MHFKYFLLLSSIAIFMSCGHVPQQDNLVAKDMKALLLELYNREDPNLNYTRNGLYVVQLQKEVAAGNSALKLELAIQLLAAGKEQDAVYTFYEFAKENISTGANAQNPDALNILYWIALAHFRLGEVNNCRDHHNTSSCIMPLNKDAQHINIDGSAAAIRLYAEILKNDPEDPIARWMVNLSAMTLGRYPNETPEAWLVNFEKFRDTIATFPKFIDVAQGLGIDKRGLFGGAVIEDFNNDGLLDLFDTDNPLNEDVRLWIRQPNGTFINTTEVAGLTGITGGANAMQTDFNNDGWADIFIVRGGWLTHGGKQPPSLLRNNGDGTFTDITAKAGLLNFSPSHSAVWADLDNDGWLDLIVAHETGTFESLENPKLKSKSPKHPTQVYRNNGNETFTDVTKSTGLVLNSWVKGVVALDYDKDGRQDIYLSIFNDENRMYKNTSQPGSISFENVSSAAGIRQPIFSFPVVSADFNNDGWPDIFVAGYHTEQTYIAREYFKDIAPMYPSYTYINQQDGTFKADSSFRLPQSIMAMSLNVGDMDNDGFVDIYLGTGAGMFTSLFPNIMLKNVEGKRWADVTTTSRLGHLQKCHGIAMADIDRDGDLDMYVELGGLFSGDYFWNALYENGLTDKANWINLKLEGDNSNKPAIGATISIKYMDRGRTKTITRTVSTGGSYGASPFEQHIGLGAAEKILNVTIVWPSGKTTECIDVTLNQHYLWKEGEAGPTLRSAVAIPLKSTEPNTQEHHHHH